MKILVTGGAGYIGNILVRKLLSNETFFRHSVTVLDNLCHKQAVLFPFFNSPYFNFVYGDVRDETLFKKLINSHDIIIHLAAYVGMPACNKYREEAYSTNFLASKFLASNISKNQYIIYPTTNSGYGKGLHVDGKAVHCTEETPLSPISIYGQTKADAELVLMNTGVCTSFRLATVFGLSDRMRLDLLVNDFVWRAYNDKFVVLFEADFVRNFVSIDDVSDLFGWMASIGYAHDHKKFNNQIFNFGNNHLNISKRELCQRIKKFVPDFCVLESEINKDPDQRNYIVSNQKITQALPSNAFNHDDLDEHIQKILNACPIIKHSRTQFTNL